MAAGVHAGLDCNLYYNSGNYAVPTWSAWTFVQDLDTPLEKDKAEVKSRQTRVKKYLPLHKQLPLNFKMLKDTSDANYAVIQSAFTNDTILDMAIADGAIATTGTVYLRGDYIVFGFKESQQLSEAVTMDVAMDVAVSSNTIGYTTVGS